MGASSREFLLMRMEEHDYNSLPPDIRERSEIEYVKVEDVDYSHDKLWQQLKTDSVKAYKKLKDREYDLRHNLKNKQ